MPSSDSTADSSVTLVIPTVHHRAKLLARALRHLSDGGFRCPILISDHSPVPHLGLIADVALRYSTLDVKVLNHSPEEHFLTRLALCAEAAQTPYVHLHADDDFLVRSGLHHLVRVMNERPDCAAAMGINLHVGFARRDVVVSAKGPIDRPEPFERLTMQLETYSSVLYALRRREEFIASATFARDRCPDVQFWQYLESCRAALIGPIAVVEELHYVRESHDAKWSAGLVRDRSPDHFPYLILSPEFCPRVTAFRHALMDACKERNVAVDGRALDDGLIHLLYRGLGVMGLPPKRIPEDHSIRDVAARLESKFTDQNDPATRELNRMFALAGQEQASR
jgi:glycosyltransferase domain-containing protein